jgi:hypothetical protein
MGGLASIGSVSGGVSGNSATGSNHDSGATVNSAQPALGQAVMPVGWRRTTRGWERAEQWLLADSFAGGTNAASAALPGGPHQRSINDWITLGVARELHWIRLVTQSARGVHPLGIALMLIGVAVVITQLSERRSERRPSGAAAPTL